jgi:hypothetical protein
VFAPGLQQNTFDGHHAPGPHPPPADVAGGNHLERGLFRNSLAQALVGLITETDILTQYLKECGAKT